MKCLQYLCKFFSTKNTLHNDSVLCLFNSLLEEKIIEKSRFQWIRFLSSNILRSQVSFQKSDNEYARDWSFLFASHLGSHGSLRQFFRKCHLAEEIMRRTGLNATQHNSNVYINTHMWYSHKLCDSIEGKVIYPVSSFSCCVCASEQRNTHIVVYTTWELSKILKIQRNERFSLSNHAHAKSTFMSYWTWLILFDPLNIYSRWKYFFQLLLNRKKIVCETGRTLILLVFDTLALLGHQTSHSQNKIFSPSCTIYFSSRAEILGSECCN